LKHDLGVGAQQKASTGKVDALGRSDTGTQQLKHALGVGTKHEASKG
jgi:hypothetical protein